jgi:hypothetical protein
MVGFSGTRGVRYGFMTGILAQPPLSAARITSTALPISVSRTVPRVDASDQRMPATLRAQGDRFQGSVDSARSAIVIVGKPSGSGGRPDRMHTDAEHAQRPADLSRRLILERLQAGDVDGVVALYESDAVLALPDA